MTALTPLLRRPRYESLVRHWANRLIEPLTARSVLAVEGPSDRILVERVAELTDLDLDRLGVAVFDLDGAKLFPFAYDVFGPGGFDLKLTGLVDEDARGTWASAVGVGPADLEAAGYVVCDPDLEGVYIDTLGVGTVIAMLLASPKMTETSMLQSCKVATLGDITRDLLWEYCKGRKVPAALAVAAALDPAQAASLGPLVAVLALAV
ncbi:MAG: ATP-dependent endonuclease [Acidimicrobiia bacterium]